VAGYAAAASAADAEAAVRAAHEAWPAWAALPVAERTAMTLKALEGLDADAAERADILSRENGKILFEATIDLHVFAGRFHQAAAFAPELAAAPGPRPAARRAERRHRGGRGRRPGRGQRPAGQARLLHRQCRRGAADHDDGRRDYVAGLCEEARGGGAEVRTFGENTSDAEGNYLLPSLVLDPPPHLKIVAEEQFGPALPVIPDDDEAEAVALANDTWSGRCSSVWSADAEHAMKIGRQLRREGMHEFTETHVMAMPSEG
jgi:acyl-CoA reductase-like NAD-dependent aldehyde dehydrogenase